MMSNVEGQLCSTLDIRLCQKINKYKNLIDDCIQQFDCKAELFVLIVSSLGAIPKDTLDDLKLLTGTESDWKKLAKKMVMTSLRESMFLYYNWFPDHNQNHNHNDDVHDDSSYRSDQSDQNDPPRCA